MSNECICPNLKLWAWFNLSSSRLHVLFVRYFSNNLQSKCMPTSSILKQ